MKKIIQYTLGSLTLITLVLAGFFYYISTIFSDDVIKNTLIAILEESIHETKASVGHVNYRIRSSLHFEIQDIDIKQKKTTQGHPLLFIKNTSIRVPIWSLFLKGGTIDIVASSPQVNYDEYRNDPNPWVLRSKSPPPKKMGPTPSKGSEHKVSLPVFLAKSSVNIRLDDTTISYRTKDNLKKNFTVDKFLIKNISLDEPIVFEIQSLIETNPDNQKQISSHFLLVGEIDTPNFLENGIIKSAMELRLTDNQLPRLPFPMPNIRSEVILSSKDQHINIELKLMMDEVFEDLKANIIFDTIGEKIEVNELSGQVNTLAIAKLIKLKTKNVDFNKSKIHISGTAKLNPSPVLDLNFKTTNKIKYILFEDPIDIGISARIQDKKFDIQFPLENSHGMGMISATATLPDDLRSASLKNLSQMKLNVVLDQIKLTKIDVEKLINLATLKMKKSFNDKISNSPDRTLQNTKKPTLPKKLLIPNFQLDLSGERLALEKSQFALKGTITAKDNIVRSKNLSLTTDSGRIKANFTSKKTIHSTNTQFNIHARKIPFKLFRSIFPKGLKNTSGTTNTKLTGTVIAGNDGLKYDIDLNLSAREGVIQDFKIDRYMSNYIKKIPLLHKKSNEEDIQFSNTFDEIIIQGRFNEDHYRFKKITFIGSKNKFHISGSGNLFPTDHNKRGSFFLSFRDNVGYIGKMLKHHTGSKNIPINLQGEGFTLTPDYKYTVDKIDQLASNFKSKKLIYGKKNKVLKKNKTPKL